MMHENKTPRELADAVCSELTGRKKDCPSLNLIVSLFETLFFTSMKTEEGQPILCHLIWLDPYSTDTNPPKRIVHLTWNYIQLAHPLPFDIRTLTKIAKASDPRTSSFVVYPDENGELKIWGLVDQGNRYHDFLHFDSDSGSERPGLFQASILAIGHLTAYIGFDRIAELRTSDLITASNDVLRSGPIRDKLKPALAKYVDGIRQVVTAEVFNERSHWTNSLESDWIATLCRLLLRTQNYRHGGALRASRIMAMRSPRRCFPVPSTTSTVTPPRCFATSR